ncbi:MAG: hypothetical protein R6V48_02920 [Fidelibacterota bacterium]
MKKFVVAILMTFVLATFSFAEMPVNHNATLIPPKASLVSVGFDPGFNAGYLEYTQGLKGTNLHVKLSAGRRIFQAQGLVRHCILEWNGIDMGFGYGGEFTLQNGTWWEVTPMASWHMSHNFTQKVDFYGGVLSGFSFGKDYWGGFAEVPVGIYYGTQIDIAKNLELYAELQTGILNHKNSAFFGVNYYIAEGIEVPKKK